MFGTIQLPSCQAGHWLHVSTGWPRKSKPLSRIIIKSY